MIIQLLSNKITSKILEDVKNDPTIEKRISDEAFGRRISVLLIYTFLFPCLILVGLIFNCEKEIIISTLTVAFLRIINGGNHFNSPDICFVVTFLAISINPLLIDQLTYSVLIYLFIPVLIIYMLFAPYNRLIDKKIVYLKKGICVLICILAYFFSDTMLITFAILSLDLLFNQENFKRLGGSM